MTIGVKNGKSYYDHYLTYIEKGNLIDFLNQSDSQDEGFKPTEGAPNTSDALSGGKDTKLLEILQINHKKNNEKVKYSLRQKPEPKKKGIGYKVFVLKDGKLYPPMVANPDGAATPVGVWLDADAAPIAGESKTGRPQVKQGGKGTQGGSGKLAYRPGWHLGVIPYAIQFNRKDAEENKTLFPKNFVFAEVEYAAEKKESLANDKSMDTATTSLGGDTALSQTKESAAKQANREDGQLLILPSNKEEVGALSDPTVNLSAAKIDNSSETAKGNGE